MQWGNGVAFLLFVLAARYLKDDVDEETAKVGTMVAATLIHTRRAFAAAGHHEFLKVISAAVDP